MEEQFFRDGVERTVEAPRKGGLTEHPLFHLALLVATFITATLAGGLAFTDSHGLLGGGSFSDGLPFSVPLLLILGSHELGHYWMCRRYGIAATLPYFLPSPLLVPPIFNFAGTFGALIRIKEPIRRKRALLEIGAAGPLTGFFMALPFLLYGVVRARPTVASSTILFDYPLIVRLAQDWMGAGRYTSAAVREHPVFMAAWFGLFVTALNLLPIGQLDGGHVLRAAAGRSQPLISLAVLALAVGSFSRAPTWAVFALFAVLLTGFRHPPVSDEEEPLGFERSLLVLACVAVFLLCFSLTPIRLV